VVLMIEKKEGNIALPSCGLVLPIGNIADAVSTAYIGSHPISRSQSKCPRVTGTIVPNGNAIVRRVV